MHRSLWIRVVVSAVAVALVGLFATAGATSAQGRHGHHRAVEIVGVEDITAGTGTFTARGGGLCRTGTTEVVGETVVEEHGTTLTFDLRKAFVCDDGSGTFVLRISAWTTPCEPTDRGVWRVVSGTGTYLSLSGKGRLVGTYVPGPCDAVEGIVDVFYGKLRHR